MKRGDHVELQTEDGERICAFVVLASQNNLSIAVMFDGLFRGYVSMMPLLREQADAPGHYRDLVTGAVIAVRAVPDENS